MMIRLIASDLDGTLLQDHNIIHPENLEALRVAKAAGAHFAVASGRSQASCILLLEAYGLDDASIIAVNGCQVLAHVHGELIVEHSLAREAAEEALRIFASYGLGTCLYTDAAIVYSSEALLAGMGNFGGQYAEKMRALGTDIQSGEAAMQRALQGKPLKVFCVRGNGQEEAFAEARKTCERIPGTSLTSSWHNNFEVMPEGVDKGAALRTLAAHLGIGREEVLAFGDDENDLPMLRWAGHAFAMGNAKALVLREIADVTGDCREGGVAQGIRRLMR